MEQIGRFLVEGELARGGMGVVLRGRDPGLNRPVAIKVLQGDGSQQQRARLVREARALARVRHPGVVPVHEAGEWRGHPYVVMDLIPGESLAERLRRQGALPADEVLRLGLALAEALGAVHQQGLLHRDIKPGNVLLDEEGAPLLTDFGLAKDLDSAESQRLTRSGVMQGTPGFWAPEQAGGELARIGPPTDVYGLGATLYAALTGEPPVDVSGSLAEILAATVRQEPRPPSALAPDVPPALEAAILACLAKEADERPASGAALLELLRAEERPHGRRASPLRWLALGVLLLAGGVSLGIVAAFDRTPPPTPAPAAPDPLAEARAVEEREGALASLPVWQRLAEAGNLRAMVRLGQLLSIHPDVPRDDPRAVTWFERAAEAGDPQAMSEIGFMYTFGRGVPTDEPRGVAWFRRGEALGNPEATSNLAYCYRHGLGVAQDMEEAVRLWRRAAEELRHPMAMLFLGAALVKGEGAQADTARGEEWLLAAAAAGKPEAYTQLASFYRTGTGLPRDAREELRCWILAGESGCQGAFHTAAELLLYEPTLERDPRRALELLERERARFPDEGRTLHLLGRVHLQGLAGPADPARALELFREGAALGDATSMYALSELYRRSRSRQENEQALVWLRRAAEADLVMAMVELGELYRTGMPLLERDPQTARRWFERAIEEVETLRAGPTGLPGGYDELQERAREGLRQLP